MRHLTLAMALVALATASCTATIDSAPGTNSVADLPAPSNPNSQIVAGMFNSYEERPELPIDSCQDSFIKKMKTLGYELSSAVEPNTHFNYSYWFTTCNYRAKYSSMVIGTTNSRNLAAQLQPANGGFLESYDIAINNRFSVVSPSTDTSQDCWVGMQTSFGSIIVTGGPLPDKSDQGQDACEDMTNFLRQLEPLLGD